MGGAPPGRDRLILGHESLGRVVDPGPTGFMAGEHVVGIVRRPDPTPCPNCAVGEWDMCSNGGYTERAAKVLAAADRPWLEQLVTRRVHPDEAQQALQRAPDGRPADVLRIRRYRRGDAVRHHCPGRVLRLDSPGIAGPPCVPYRGKLAAT
jgi:hypothetical protein